MTRPRRLESATCPLSPAPAPGLPESPHASSSAMQAWLPAKPKPNLAKPSKIQPSRNKGNQRKRAGFPWFPLSILSLFSWLRRPPRQKIFLALLPPRAPARLLRLVRRLGHNIMDSVFRKEKIDSRALPGRDRALAQAGSSVDSRAPTIVSSSPQFNAIDGFASHFPPQWIAHRLFRAIIMRARRVGPGVGRPSHVC
jgi:hypothetical protein